MTAVSVVDTMHFYREILSYSCVWSRAAEAEAKLTHILRIQGPQNAYSCRELVSMALEPFYW